MLNKNTRHQASHFENLTQEIFGLQDSRLRERLANNSNQRIHIHPYTLFYSDWKMERMFRDDLYLIPSKQLVRLCGCLFALWLLSVWTTWVSKSAKTDAADKTQFAIFIIGLSLIITMFVVGSGMIIHDPRLKAKLLACFVWIFGLVVAFHSGYLRRLMRLPASSTLLIATLVVQHVIAKFMFVVTTATSSSTSLLYIILVFTGKWDDTRTEDVWSNVWYVLVANTALLFSSYEFEIYRRHSFVRRRRAEQQRDVMKEEAKMVKAEMYDYVLRNLDIADMKEEDDIHMKLDLKTPMEKAMDLLVSLSKNEALATNEIEQVKQVMAYLASSSDVFRPNNIDKDNNIDPELQEWLYNLLDEPRAMRSHDGSTIARSADDFMAKEMTKISEENSTLVIMNTNNDVDDNSASAKRAWSDSVMNRVPPQHDDNNNNNNNNGDDDDYYNVNTRSRGSSNHREYSTSGRKTTNNREMSVSGRGFVYISNDEHDQIGAVEVVSTINRYDFDVFRAHDVSKSHPIQLVGSTLFKELNLLHTFKISRNTLRNFLTVIEAGYNENPYHNAIHAADVAQTMYYHLTASKIRESLSDVELLAAVVAAMIHDFDHPGRSNAFLVNTLDRKALLYNDRAVLENHHVAAAFIVMLKKENNITQHMTHVQFAQFRRSVIDMVLVTDLAHHFEFLSHFKQATATEMSNEAIKADTKEAHDYRLMLLKMAIKCADVGHTSKPLELHKNWTGRIMEEFYKQGDEELENKMEVSPFMDRRKKNVPKSQIGFMNILVEPMYEMWMQYLGIDHDILPILTTMKQNRDYWKQIQQTTREQNKRLYRINSISSTSAPNSTPGVSRQASISNILSRMSSNSAVHSQGSQRSLPPPISNDTTSS